MIRAERARQLALDLARKMDEASGGEVSYGTGDRICTGKTPKDWHSHGAWIAEALMARNGRVVAKGWGANEEEAILALVDELLEIMEVRSTRLRIAAETGSRRAAALRSTPPDPPEPEDPPAEQER